MSLKRTSSSKALRSRKKTERQSPSLELYAPYLPLTPRPPLLGPPAADELPRLVPFPLTCLLGRTRIAPSSQANPNDWQEYFAL